VATLLVVPVVLLAYRADLHTADWLSVNARARVIIWAATAEQARQHPFLGVGAGSTKRLGDMRPKEERPGHVLPWSTSLHAHNVYLQTWYELGFIGAILLLTLGLSLLSSISQLSPTSQGFALSTFVSGATIAGLSWGMWQPWFMATYFLTLSMLAIGIRQSAIE
jgi:O-antigen ligase